MILSDIHSFYTKIRGICVGVYMSPERVFVYVILFPLLSLFVIAFDIHPLYTKNRGICEGIYISSISCLQNLLITYLESVIPLLLQSSNAV